MGKGREYEQTVGRLESMLRKGEVVWQQFHPSIRPDVGRVVQSITIGKISSTHLPIHPSLPYDFREKIAQNLLYSGLVDRSSLITYTDAVSGRTILTQRALGLPDRALERTMYYHAAADLSLRMVLKNRWMLNEREQEGIEATKSYFASRGFLCQPDGVACLGFRKIVTESSFALAEIEDLDVADALNFLFPSAMEILTEGIRFNDGDVRVFLHNLRQGIAGLSPIEDHPSFAVTLYESLMKLEHEEYGGWQALLIGLRTGDRDGLLGWLDPITGSSDATGNLIGNLLVAYRDDETAMRGPMVRNN